jgi:hypothetical protein
MRYWLGPHNQACSDPAPVEPAPALSAPEFVILLTTKQLEVDPGRSRPQPHSGLDRAVFHARWDDVPAPRGTSAACGLCAAQRREIAGYKAKSF